MMNWEDEQLAIKDAIARFPKFFQLPDCKGTCRISETASFFSGPTLYLYTEVEIDGKWHSWAKGTESELKKAIRYVPAVK